MENVNVVLAHHWWEKETDEHHDPGEELSVAEDLARGLVDAGVANFATLEDAVFAGGDRKRIAPPPEDRASSNRAPTKAQLLDEARGLGLDVSDSDTKKEIAAAIAGVHAQQGE